MSSVYSSGGGVGGGSFSVTRTVGQLLNDNLPAGCAAGGCPVAGFSENLHVYATTTDGWSRQSQYDASFVRAFVLAPPVDSPSARDLPWPRYPEGQGGPSGHPEPRRQGPRNHRD